MAAANASAADESDQAKREIWLANVVAKRVGAGYVGQPQEFEVPRDTLERPKLSLNGVEKMCVRVQDRLESVLAQYQAA